jgi:ferredoxin-type protein NapH
VVGMTIRSWRWLAQVLGAIIPNSYFAVFFKEGSLYQGSAKAIVPPTLNCYATPSAYTSCPLGSMQHFFTIRALPAFVIGILGVVGVTVGRMPCAWLCPFGLLQDLLHKIPTPKLSIPSFMRYFKYLVLLVLVIILPLVLAETYFCMTCPAGALTGGIPQVLMNPPLKEILGWLYTTKMIILAVVLILSILISRFFCKVLCPLGAILGLFNPISIVRLEVAEDSCQECFKCSDVCPMDIDPLKTPNSPECIRCLACVENCHFSTIKLTTSPKINSSKKTVLAK